MGSPHKIDVLLTLLLLSQILLQNGNVAPQWSFLWLQSVGIYAHFVLVNRHNEINFSTSQTDFFCVIRTEINKFRN